MEKEFNKRMEKHMNVTRVIYTLRKTLGQYEHEELTCEVARDAESKATGEQMMEQAIRLCRTNTHKNLGAHTNGVAKADSLPQRGELAPHGATRPKTGTTSTRATTPAKDSRRPYAKKEKTECTQDFVDGATFKLNLPQWVPGNKNLQSKESGIYALLNNHDWRFSFDDKRWYGYSPLNLPDSLGWVYDYVEELNQMPRGEDMVAPDVSFDDDDSIPF